MAAWSLAESKALSSVRHPVAIRRPGTDRGWWSPEGDAIYFVANERLLRSSFSTANGVQIAAPELVLEQPASVHFHDGLQVGER